MSTAKITFDVAWKEKDQLHLVKPLSFDLKRLDALNKKAYQYYGQYIHLQEYAQNNNYLFDVLLVVKATPFFWFALYFSWQNSQMNNHPL